MAYNKKSKARRQAEARKKPGRSNVGKYPNVSKFAGPSG